MNGESPRRVVYRNTVEYEVADVSDIFDPANPALLSDGGAEGARRFVVVDDQVERIHAAAIRRYFAENRVEARIFVFPGGEEQKTFAAYLEVARALDLFPIHRRDEPVIAIGGGVLTDVVGFVAGSYRRGVPHIRVPTTLMGYLDAAIGAKTGVNFEGHKNRLGMFAPPRRVLLDRSFLRTLPLRHLRNGACEILKLAVIKDAGLFDLLERSGPHAIEDHFQGDAGRRILDRAVSGMLEELEANLFEEELARRMDFGHTFSYGLETLPEAGLLHGEAVWLDVALSALIARTRGLLSEVEVGRIFRLANSLGFPLDPAVLDPAALWDSLTERTCHRNGRQRVPLPQGLGGCYFANDVAAAEIETAVEALRERAGAGHVVIR